MKSKLLLLLILTCLFTLTAAAQSDTTEVDKDTVDVEDWDSWEDWDDFEVHVFEDEFKGAPTIYLSYGGQRSAVLIWIINLQIRDHCS